MVEKIVLPHCPDGSAFVTKNVMQLSQSSNYIIIITLLIGIDKFINSCMHLTYSALGISLSEHFFFFFII